MGERIQKYNEQLGTKSIEGNLKHDNIKDLLYEQDKNLQFALLESVKDRFNGNNLEEGEELQNVLEEEEEDDEKDEELQNVLLNSLTTATAERTSSENILELDLATLNQKILKQKKLKERM